MIYKKIDTHAAVFCCVSEEVAHEYIDFRLSVKKPLTQGAFNRAMNQAASCGNLGLTSNEAIAMTIDKGWHGVTPEYIAKELENRREAAMKVSLGQSMQKVDTRSRTLQQQLDDKSWAN